MDKNNKLIKILLLGQPTKLKEKLIYKIKSRKISEINYRLRFGVFTSRIRIDDYYVKLFIVLNVDVSTFNFSNPITSRYRGVSAGIIVFNKGDKNHLRR